MSKQEQVLIIEPQNELKFKGPFNVPVTSYMKLSNPTDRRVLFKIKTTAPKKYCVRPNSGLLQPGSSTEIAISLQPVEFGQTEKNKHKFMVQTVFAPDGEINFDQLWKDILPEQLMDSKLKCVFENPQPAEVQEDPSTKISPKSNSAIVTNFNSTVDTELQKAASEVQQLREEESALRQENLRLKEEVLQLKQQAGKSANINRYAPPAHQENMTLLIVVAVVLGMVGVLLGKYVL